MRYGLNQPILVQYWDYLRGLVTGQFGTSIQSGQAVSTEIAGRLGATVKLIVVALAIAFVAAVIFGLIAATRRDRPADHLIRLGSLIGNALPDFWLGLLLILVVYNALHWAPTPSGQIDPSITLRTATGAYLIDGILSLNGPAIVSALWHLMLPAATLALVVSALFAPHRPRLGA